MSGERAGDVNVAASAHLSPTTLADVLSRDRVMDPEIRPLWNPKTLTERTG